MIRSIYFLIIFCISLILSLLLFVPYGFLVLFRRERLLKRYIKAITAGWSKLILLNSGASVEVTGEENLPEAENLCFISNHQGYADIVLIFGYIKKTVGFIAKKELSRVPILGFWIKSVHCIFLDRKNIRDGLKRIQQGVENIKNGNPMVIFPEGTRSRGSEMGPFKRGSFKLAFRSDSVIVPLTINNTYKLYEETGRIRPTKIYLTIHPPIDTSALSQEERRELPEKLHSIIESGILKTS